MGIKLSNTRGFEIMGHLTPNVNSTLVNIFDVFDENNMSK